MTLARRLGATYRLQLRPGWGFAAAARTVPYLARLGVETVYLSPVAEAVLGSTHGYDGTDPTRLREELGGTAAYDTLVDACSAHGLGICVDHVPNHLATWHRGPWWRRLLAEGRDSDMGDVFDIDWDAGSAGATGAGATGARANRRPQVALPLLDRPLADALDAGLVRLGARHGETVIEVGDGTIDLPVSAGTARSDDDVAEVLAAQHYRLVDWHDASARNYRRFFDIDGLVGVRVEVPSVFDRTHALIAELAGSGRLSAVRVDHVDGLRDPTGYLRRLADVTGVPVVVEKILTGDEQLRRDWPVAGTTGYEVIDDIGGVLVDADGLEELVAAGRFDGDQPVQPLTVETRALVTAASFPAELSRAGRALGVGSAALGEVVVRLPKYRTYLRPLGEPATAAGSDEDEEIGVWSSAADAAADAAGAAPAAEAVLDRPGLHAVVAAVADPLRRHGALSLQQLTGAVMAKGVEDTAWYRLAGPLAFCEVGGDPALDRHGAVERFHARAEARAVRGTLGLVPGTTHDTKRSEDVRCRLYALSEHPAAFERGLTAVRSELGLPAGGGDLAFETRIAVQLALAVLPPAAAMGTVFGPGEETVGQDEREGEGEPGLGDAVWPEGTSLAERLGAALEKGAREAKLRSSWHQPDPRYEERLHGLASALLADGATMLHRGFGPLVPDLARRGAVNSLSAVVLRHAAPGTPDTYQGDESWNLSLVDPDNRRPVDHHALAQILERLAGAGQGWSSPTAVESLRRSWVDGRIKLCVTAACLTARRGLAAQALAPAARYVPLAAEGRACGSVIAFGRADPAGDGQWVVAMATRRPGALQADAKDLPCGPSFARTVVPLPPGAPARYRDALSGRTVQAADGRLALDDVLSVLPVALLVSVPDHARAG